MAISSCIKNGKQIYRVYVQGYGKKDRSLRVQKSKFNLETLKEAQREEKRLIKFVAEKLAKIEGLGLKWVDIIDRWETSARCGHLGDRYLDPFARNVHVRRLERYTKPWFKVVASDLTKGDGRMIINAAKNDGASVSLLRQIKSSVNVIFNWAIEERLILGVHSSPTDGLQLKEKVEKVPKIMTQEQVRKLLGAARLQAHPWYSIWAFAYLTGMRSGELKALQWKDIDFETKIIRVTKSYCQKRRGLKSTKAGYWRNVPISKDLMSIINDLKEGRETQQDQFILSRVAGWSDGMGGKVLRDFLKSIGIDKDIVFHTLRACFATHMLASGVDQATVMKIGGWRDIKTFQIYLRLAGVEVFGATEVLNVLPPAQPEENAQLIQLSQFR